MSEQQTLTTPDKLVDLETLKQYDAILANYYKERIEEINQQIEAARPADLDGGSSTEGID